MNNALFFQEPVLFRVRRYELLLLVITYSDAYYYNVAF